MHSLRDVVTILLCMFTIWDSMILALPRIAREHLQTPEGLMKGEVHILSNEPNRAMPLPDMFSLLYSLILFFQ